MKRLFKTMVFLMCFLMLSACATMQQEPLPLNQAQVHKLSYGMSNDALSQLLAQNVPNYTFSKEYEGNQYQVSVYTLVIGTESVLDMNCEYRGPCVPVDVDQPITTEFVLIQNLPELTLADWGTVEHLSKSKSNKTKALMIEVNHYIDAQKTLN